MHPRFFLLLLPAASLAADPAATAEHAAQMTQGVALFNSEVGKLLAENCVKCHGGEKGVKGDLDLTTREALMKGGESGASVVPGKSGESLLMKSIRHEDKDLKMPKKADKLSDAAIAKIAQWVDLGAPYGKSLGAANARDRSKVTEADRKWWAFQPLAKTPPGAVKNAAWSRNGIDPFVLEKLEAKGLAPSPAAEKRVLIRRAYFDLIGLPPTPEQIERFLADTSPKAYEKVVEELLASPHYGERWGRHWLDLARYAESHGYEQDYDRPNAWHYRDYVIRALNADQPFDEFVRWQIAGDELAPDNPEAWKATGFLAAGTHATQITANQAEKERYDELDDMAATIGTSMLGLTVGCARCHDHKYDPIPSRDYYRLISTFTKTVRSDYDLTVDTAETKAAKAKWQTEHAGLVATRDRFEKEQLPARMVAWERSGARPAPAPWLTLDKAVAKSEGGATLTPQADGSFLASGAKPELDTYTFTAPLPATAITGVKLEALADASLVKQGPGRAENGNFALSGFELTVTPPGGAAVAAKFVKALATFEQTGLPVAAAIDADKMSSWAIDPQFGKNHAAIFILDAPLAAPVGSTLKFTLRFQNNKAHSIGRPRLSVTTMAQPGLEPGAGPTMPADARTVLDVAATQRTEAQRGVLLKWYRTQDAEYRKLDAAVSAHAAAEPKPQKVKALVSSEGVPAVRNHTQGPDFYDKTFFLTRGDLNKKQDEAQPGFLTVLANAPEDRWSAAPPTGSRTPWRRAALAKWMTDTEAGAGPLVARVIVNRLWQHHFGRGLVATPSDFGAQGEKPTHPELLDWLAGELIRSGWKLKRLHLLMMTSAAYVQTAETGDRSSEIGKARAADPDNSLIWRHSRQRLEGEIIRDSILAVTGTLDPKPFGPGTLDGAMKRRSIYFQIKRSQLPPMMVTFDAPDTLGSLGLRSSTTVAPQALLLMNNAQVRASAREWAKKLAALPANDAVKRSYLAALGRPPADEEQATAGDFLRAQTASYEAAGKGDAAELALTDFCQSLVSLNEFVYVE
ncbi:MAG: PSD1 and planctomycete cytochrome C domain-containing protein [Chthoniobacter sp.]|nr:PSD1 and planctomycete cytochrome C domain-containing protein [Chthoniobacter sp.]